MAARNFLVDGGNLYSWCLCEIVCEFANLECPGYENERKNGLAWILDAKIAIVSHTSRWVPFHWRIPCSAWRNHLGRAPITAGRRGLHVAFHIRIAVGPFRAP